MNRTRTVVVAAGTAMSLVVSSALLALTTGVPAAALTPTIVSLGIAGVEAVALDGGGLAVMAIESQEGADLNGDGDTTDQVPHVWDPVAGATNLGIASVGDSVALDGGDIASVALDGGGLAFMASEPGQGADLNGDGDTTDQVPHVWDPAGGITNLTIASRSGGTALDGGGLTFTASESGEGADLNGDQDTTDLVPQVWNPAGGTTSLGIAGDEPVALDGGGLTFTASESGEGADLNGDGDISDFDVPQVWNPAGGITDLAIAGGELVALDRGGLTFAAFESGEGADLNGDGDTTDRVPQVWNPAGGTTNLGIASLFSLVALDGGGLTFAASESGEGADLNGDGDTTDRVPQVWNPAGGTTNLGIASVGSLIALDGGRLTFTASEPGQLVNLNGDGDTSDVVPQVWDPAGGTTSLGIAGGELAGFELVALDGGGLAFMASETGQNAILNDDIDTTDVVPHVWDPVGGVTNLGIATGLADFGVRVPLVSLDGGGLVFVASESAEYRVLNGDGDGDDLVPHMWDALGGVTNLSLASAGSSPVALDGGSLVFLASESGQRADFNGDGDTNDFVPHVAVDDALPPGVSGVTVSPSPVVTGTALTLVATIDDATTGGSDIASATYSVDGGSAVAMSPSDGAFDEVTEAVTAAVPPFETAGPHAMCVSGADAAGNTSAPACISFEVFASTDVHDVGVRVFRTRGRVSPSSSQAITLQLKNFGTVPETVDYSVTSSRGSTDVFTADCSGLDVVIGPGQTVHVQNCTVTYGSGGPVTLQAHVVHDATHPPDANPANDTATKSVTVK